MASKADRHTGVFHPVPVPTSGGKHWKAFLISLAVLVLLSAVAAVVYGVLQGKETPPAAPAVGVGQPTVTPTKVVATAKPKATQSGKVPTPTLKPTTAAVEVEVIDLTSMVSVTISMNGLLECSVALPNNFVQDFGNGSVRLTSLSEEAVHINYAIVGSAVGSAWANLVFMGYFNVPTRVVIVPSNGPPVRKIVFDVLAPSP